MTKRILYKKSADNFHLNESYGEASLQWNSSSSNEESFFDHKSEVLWSREKNDFFSENDFFQSFHDGFSDLTEGTASSCSWHNDDFDMNSSNKVKASLEAVEDALHEQQQSSVISKSVYQECCDWANKFPYFRLKGKQIVTPSDLLHILPGQNVNSNSEYSASSLQVEGKKMAIHIPEKAVKKTFGDSTAIFLNGTQDYFEETFDDDGEYEECFELDPGKDTCNKILKFMEEESSNTSSVKLTEDKVIERIALEIWPKVIAVLQKLDDAHNHINTTIIDISEGFQLPPIVPVVEQRQVLRRPRTEGTDLPIPDFPKLNSILSISPKILQSKRDYGSCKGIQRSSRPNSEIHLSHRNHPVSSLRGKNEPIKVISYASQQNNTRQLQLSSSKLTIQEKQQENISLFLPAVDEDILESSEVLKGFNLDPKLKEFSSTNCDTTSLSKKSECFLPPINRKNYVPSNVKLTRNLFTFFGSQLKCDKSKADVSTNRPVTRPNTSTSRKTLKYSANIKHRLLNDGRSSINHAKCTETKKLSEVNLDKQVTLFPIVTSMIPNKERHSSGVKKGTSNTFGDGLER